MNRAEFYINSNRPSSVIQGSTFVRALLLSYPLASHPTAICESRRHVDRPRPCSTERGATATCKAGTQTFQKAHSWIKPIHHPWGIRAFNFKIMGMIRGMYLLRITTWGGWHRGSSGKATRSGRSLAHVLQQAKLSASEPAGARSRQTEAGQGIRSRWGALRASL